MSLSTYKITPESGQNALSFGGNYRIFSVEDDIVRAKRVTEIIEDLSLGSAVEAYINRWFRYSKDKLNWSMWYKFDLEPNVSPYVPDPDDMSSVITSLPFDPEESLYVQFKYEYDDGTADYLESPLVINEIKMRVDTDNPSVPTSVLTPKVSCSSEGCSSLVFMKQHTFEPYAVGSAVGVFKELSFYVNRMFGHDVIYFKANPDPTSGDYIFKEWALYKVSSVKCLKVMVVNNEFPDAKPKFEDEGVTYDIPFEVEIDKRYFESVFGTCSEPRKEDFLYFPLLNRMYRIQGSYLTRGMMMQPIYYKATLEKFEKNINYIMQPEHRQFLDNLLVDSEQIFQKQVESDIRDAEMPQQYKTISTHSDETRGQINESLSIRPLDFFFNYSSLVENYYDMQGVAAGDFGVSYKYKPSMDESDNQNMSYACLFNVRASSQSISFLYGKRFGSPVETPGIEISGAYASTNQRLTVKVDVNGNVYSVNANGVSMDKWYCLIVTASREFGQIGVFVYDVIEDPNDPQNHVEFDSIVSKWVNVDPDQMTFSVDDTYKILGSPVWLANIRLFKRALKPEDHQLIMSQLFLKDESMLYFIDNNRPRLNAPYVQRNR